MGGIKDGFGSFKWIDEQLGGHGRIRVWLERLLVVFDVTAQEVGTLLTLAEGEGVLEHEQATKIKAYAEEFKHRLRELVDEASAFNDLTGQQKADRVLGALGEEYPALPVSYAKFALETVVQMLKGKLQQLPSVYGLTPPKASG